MALPTMIPVERRRGPGGRRWVRVPGKGTALRGLAAIGGGAALYLSFPPRSMWWLAPVAFGLLGLASHGRRARAGLGYGFLFGVSFLAPLLHWTGIYVGAIAWLPLTAIEAVIIGAGCAAIAVVTTSRMWPVWAALLWVTDEAIRARVPFGGLPWGKLAFGQPDGAYASLAALGGTPLVAFAVTLTGFGLTAVTLWLARPRQHGSFALVGALMAVVLPIGAGLVAWPSIGSNPNAGMATVAAIQGNVPRLGLDFNAQRRAVLDNHVAETEKLAARVNSGLVSRPDLVIWPENSSDIDPYANPDAYAEISAAAVAIAAPIEVGAVVTSQPPGMKNAALLWEPGRGPVAEYVKRRLQPFGETMPWRPFFRLFTPYADEAGNFVPGTKPVVFPMGPARVGLDTCFEVAFDDVVRDSVTAGGTLLAVPTNNATFGRGDMTYQQLAMDRERAIEHGRSVIVAATSGVSAIILPDGNVVRYTEIFTPAALVATVPLRSNLTLADRLGWWPEWVMVTIGVVALASIAVARIRRSRNTGPNTEATP